MKLLAVIIALQRLPSSHSGAQPLSTSCTCDCCEVEQRQTPDAPLGCAFAQVNPSFRSPYRVQHSCSDLCVHNSTDKIITDVEESQMDTQRFCWFECEPKVDTVGGVCAKKQNKAQAHPSKAPPKAVDVVHHKKRAAHLARGSTWHRMVASHMATKAEPWPSMANDASEIGLRAEAESKQAAKQRAAAMAAAAASAKTAATNAKIMPSLKSSLEQSITESRHAHAAEKYATDLVKEVQISTSQAAHDVIEQALEQVRDQAHAEAKVEAEKKAKALMLKLLAEIPAAAKAASKPYIDAMNRAHAYAGQYEELANGLVGKAMGLQLNAKMTLGGANAWNSLGETGKAQSSFQQAHQMMDLAVMFTKQAGAFYSASAEVLSHDSEWIAESMQASYHATLMRNPDAAANTVR